jgi:hypothetical protein
MVERAVLTFEDWMRQADRRLRAVERRRSVSGGDGSRTPYSTAAAIAYATTGGGATVTTTVTLPADRFTVAPLLYVSPWTSVPQNVFVGTASPTTTSFVLYLNRAGTSTATSIYWFAVQMTANAAVGLGAGSGSTVTDTASVTCPTDGCQNQGVAIAATTAWTDNEGDHTVDRVVCGVCGTELWEAA